jgi:azurin
MAHNFVLLTMNADAAAFANAAAKARDNEYIPTDMEDQIIAHTDLAAGGETVEVTFTAPEETGEYEYICSFPGHYSGGMKGMLNVKE